MAKPSAICSAVRDYAVLLLQLGSKEVLSDTKTPKLQSKVEL